MTQILFIFFLPKTVYLEIIEVHGIPLFKWGEPLNANDDLRAITIM